MNEFITLFVLAVGLSMDAFAVAVCKGLAMKKMSWKNAVIVGLWFGTFQKTAGKYPSAAAADPAAQCTDYHHTQLLSVCNPQFFSPD